MKLNSVKIGLPEPVDLILPRNPPIAFKCQMVPNLDEFDELVPEPVPRTKTDKDGVITKLVAEPAFLKAIDTRNNKRIAYMVIKSLEPTPGLEWEKVIFSDPETWDNYKDDFQDFGLTESEISYMVNFILENNMITEKRVKEARSAFLAMQQGGQV